MNHFTAEDRRLLGASIEGVLARAGSTSGGGGGYPLASAETWSALAELGVLALPFAEEFGGLGLDRRETGTVMKTLGCFASTEPVLSTVVLGGGVISRCDDKALKAALLPQIAAGMLRLALAFSEPGSRYNLSHVEVMAREDGDGFVLNGHKAVVLGAASADRIIVSARTSGAVSDRWGVSLFLVDRGASGLMINAYETVDGRDAGEIMLDTVRVKKASLIGPRNGALAILEQVIDDAALAVCNEAVGAMERLNEATLAYCKDRIAFGQPLSRLQVIQHRLVDMHVAIEHAAAMTASANAMCESSPVERAMQVSAAMATVCREGMFIGESAVQLHGASGITEDLDIGRYFKRIVANSMYFGNRDHHLQRYLDLRTSGPEKVR